MRGTSREGRKFRWTERRKQDGFKDLLYMFCKAFDCAFSGCSPRNVEILCPTVVGQCFQRFTLAKLFAGCCIHLQVPSLLYLGQLNFPKTERTQSHTAANKLNSHLRALKVFNYSLLTSEFYRTVLIPSFRNNLVCSLIRHHNMRHEYLSDF